jgi:hypothetical protein
MHLIAVNEGRRGTYTVAARLLLRRMFARSTRTVPGLQFADPCTLLTASPTLRHVRSGSWPRDNAPEEVWAALDRSVAAERGRFEHIFSDFGLEATVVRATHPERF